MRTSRALYNYVPTSIKYRDVHIKITDRPHEMNVSVVTGDTIGCALSLRARGFNPLVLNFADDEQPGGLVEFGFNTQEEDLFRRSNYFLTLINEFYPLRNEEAVYSQDVTVFRDSESCMYCEIDPVQISFIASPALRGPWSDGKWLQNQRDIAMVTEKIRLMFSIALMHGHDSLVLGAWGCGAFANPADHISKLFRLVCDEFDGCFKRVIFPIPGGNNNKRIFDIFENTLCNK